MLFRCSAGGDSNYWTGHKSTMLLFDTWENASCALGVVSERRGCLIALQEKVSAKADVMSLGVP